MHLQFLPIHSAKSSNMHQDLIWEYKGIEDEAHNDSVLLLVMQTRNKINNVAMTNTYEHNRIANCFTPTLVFLQDVLLAHCVECHQAA